MRMTGRRQIEKVRGARGLAVAEDNERRADERRLAVKRGPVPWPSQFTSEGAGLEGGEELIQRFPSAIVFSALGIDRSDSPSVFALVIGRWDEDAYRLYFFGVDIRHAHDALAHTSQGGLAVSRVQDS